MQSHNMQYMNYYHDMNITYCNTDFSRPARSPVRPVPLHAPRAGALYYYYYYYSYSYSYYYQLLLLLLLLLPLLRPGAFESATRHRLCAESPSLSRSWDVRLADRELTSKRFQGIGPRIIGSQRSLQGMSVHRVDGR